jgi:hypothetical protein
MGSPAEFIGATLEVIEEILSSSVAIRPDLEARLKVLGSTLRRSLGGRWAN